MTKNLDNLGLKFAADQYDLFFIDLWGVIHNGIELHRESVDVLEKLSKKNKESICEFKVSGDPFLRNLGATGLGKVFCFVLQNR